MIQIKDQVYVNLQPKHNQNALNFAEFWFCLPHIRRNPRCQSFIVALPWLPHAKNCMRVISSFARAAAAVSFKLCDWIFSIGCSPACCQPMSELRSGELGRVSPWWVIYFLSSCRILEFQSSNCAVRFRTRSRRSRATQLTRCLHNGKVRRSFSSYHFPYHNLLPMHIIIVHGTQLFLEDLWEISITRERPFKIWLIFPRSHKNRDLKSANFSSFSYACWLHSSGRRAGGGGGGIKLLPLARVARVNAFSAFAAK
jgi:hypothetical protein